MRNKFYAGLLLIFTFSVSRVSAQMVTDMTGNFSGKSKITVNWCRLDSLNFDISIDEKGNVSGKIGDAQITTGYFKMNPKGGRKYIIEAYLLGALIRNENVNRQYIFIPLDSKGSKLKGEFNTNGIKIAGKETLELRGSDLVLTKKSGKK